MCGSMVDIRSAAAEIRRGKKIEEEERNHTQDYNGLPYNQRQSRSTDQLATF